MWLTIAFLVGEQWIDAISGLIAGPAVFKLHVDADEAHVAASGGNCLTGPPFGTIPITGFGAYLPIGPIEAPPAIAIIVVRTGPAETSFTNGSIGTGCVLRLRTILRAVRCTWRICHRPISGGRGIARVHEIRVDRGVIGPGCRSIVAAGRKYEDAAEENKAA